MQISSIFSNVAVMLLCCCYVIKLGCSHCKHDDVTSFLCRYVASFKLLVVVTIKGNFDLLGVSFSHTVY